MRGMKNYMKNVKLTRWYIALTYDFLFFLFVQVYFLNQVKNISYESILLLESIFSIFKILVQMPIVNIIKRIGLLLSFRLGPILICFSLLLFIFAPSFYVLVLAYLLKAIGWSFINISSSSLLYNELKQENQTENYSKYYGLGQSTFIFLNIFSSLFSGFLFSLNGYLPLILCLIIHIVSVIISFKVNVINDKNLEKVFSNNTNLKRYKLVLKNKFCIYVFLISMIFWGILGVYDIYNMNYLESIGISVNFCTIIMSCVSFFGFIFSRYQYKIKKVLKSNNYIVMTFCLIIPSIFAGLCYICKFSSYTLLIVMLLALLFQVFTRNQFRIYALDYINQFSSPELRIDSVGLYYLFEAIGRFFITYVGSLIINFSSIGGAYVLFLFIFICPLFLLALKIKKLLDNVKT